MLKSELRAVLADHARMEALGLPVGSVSQHSVCPVCNGGNSREKSFSVKRELGGLFYRCWRSKCGAHGHVYSSGAPTDDEAPRKRQFGAWKGHTEALSEGTLNELQIRWGLDRGVLSREGVKWDTEGGRVVFPIYDSLGRDMGVVRRSLDPNKKPKTLTHWEDNAEVSGHFPISNYRMWHIWLVEDIPSALRLTKYVDAAALLGTNITDAMVADLKRADYTQIHLALDPDATGKAFAHKDRLGLLFGNFSVIPLSKDIKDMNENELEKLMYVYGT